MTRLRPAGFGGTSLSFSGSRFAAWYFLVQALGIAAWWIYLSAEPSAVPMFLPRGAAEADLRAFQMPDLLVAAPVSLAASVSSSSRCDGRCRWHGSQPARSSMPSSTAWAGRSGGVGRGSMSR